MQKNEIELEWNGVAWVEFRNCIENCSSQLSLISTRGVQIYYNSGTFPDGSKTPQLQPIAKKRLRNCSL